MLSDPVLFALLSGVMLALITGSLGCFVVWRRMAYFGDAISHSALIGVALGLWWELDMRVAVLLVALLFAFLLTMLRRDTRFSADTLLGILAHGGLAAGMVLVTLSEGAQHAGHAAHAQEDGHALIHEVLFGDILQLTMQDVQVLMVAVVVMGALLLRYWRALLLMTLHEDIAQVEGVRIERMNAVLMAMLALTVALAVKMVGMLLIASLLILPAAGARYLAGSPVGMARYAVLLGMLAVIGGMLASHSWMLPAGPAIVLVAVLLFAVLFMHSVLRTRR